MKTRAKAAPVSTPPPAARAGYGVREWCEAIPCSRAGFYNFAARDPHLIKTCKLGGKTLILISPADYLAAKAREQQIAPVPVRRGAAARAAVVAKSQRASAPAST
jgi:hypothetical protein